MARKDEQGLMQATAEDVEVLTPGEVPEWVDCYVSKRQIPGQQARLVAYKSGKNVWVHKRFLGEFDLAHDEDEDEDDFSSEYEDLELGEPAGEGDDDDDDSEE